MPIRKIRVEYGIGVLCVALMAALHALLLPWLAGGHNLPFMLGTVVVALAAAGAGPAILTAVLAFVVSES